MFGISETELALIALFGFLLFGPDKLPGMGRTIGRVLKQFRQAQEDFNEVVQTEVINPMNDAVNGTGNDDTAQKKAQGLHDALSDDADIADDADEASSEPVVRKESFAERRARLEKEKQEREKRAQEKLERAQHEQLSTLSNTQTEQKKPAQSGAQSSKSEDNQADEESGSCDTAQDVAAEKAGEQSAVAASAAPNPLSAQALYALKPKQRLAQTAEARDHYEPELAQDADRSACKKPESTSAPACEDTTQKEEPSCQ